MLGFHRSSSLSLMPRGSHFCQSLTAHGGAAEGNLGALDHILGGAVGRGPPRAGEGHADL